MDTFYLNTSICNKCFVPKYRSKEPYLLTQCAHIFCQDCWQKANKQCTQCGVNEIMTVELNEQMPPKVKSLFEPLAETFNTFYLEMIRIDGFRNNQLKIFTQRFMELEKKYETLKKHYWTMREHMKNLMQKYTHQNSEKDKHEKMSAQFQRNSLRYVPSTTSMNSTGTQTPVKSNIYMNPYSSGYSSESMGPPITPVNITPSNPRKQHKVVDSFRISTKRKDMSMNSYDTMNSNSKIIFRKK